MYTILIAIFVLVILGIFYEQYKRHISKDYKVDGKFIDIGGHKLHYVLKGDGSPTVIFESGLDYGGHIVWRNIQEKLSINCTTLSYDRAGILRSQRGENPKTCEFMAEELHSMLEALKLPKPYILVGHSLAGLIYRCYIDKYSSDVAGVVLLDPTHPESFENFPKKLKDMQTKTPAKWLVKVLSLLSILRLSFKMIFKKFYNNILKSEEENYQEAHDMIHHSIDAYLEEWENLTLDCQESKGISFGTVPVTVLGATTIPMDKPDYHKMMDVMKTCHEETVSHCKESKLILVDSGHVIQAEKPDVVVEAIREMVEKNKKDIKK